MGSMPPNEMPTPRQRLRKAVREYQAKTLERAAAGQLFRELLTHTSVAAEAANMLGVLALDMNQCDQAAAWFQRAIETDDQQAGYYLNLAGAIRVQGKFAEAERLYRKAIQLKPDFAEAFFNYFDAQNYADGSDLQPLLEQHLANTHQFSQEDQCFLHFAASKLYDDIGTYDRAFQQMQLGNRARAVNFDPVEHTREIDAIIQATPADLFVQRFGTGVADFRPIFVVGMPRSGTTLIESRLDRHPQVVGLGELRDVPSMVTAINEHPRIPGHYPDCLATMPAEAFVGFAQTYAATARRLGQGAARIVDKMPLNHRHLGLVALLFPNAHIVHCLRDPRDVCLSCYSKRFRTSQEYSYNLDHLASVYADYQRVMLHWKQVLPIGIHDVRYESMIAETDRELRRMLEFLELDWHDDCARTGENKDSGRVIRTASSWQARQPVYQSAVQRWRNYEEQLQPLLLALEKQGVELP